MTDVMVELSKDGQYKGVCFLKVSSFRVTYAQSDEIIKCVTLLNLYTVMYPLTKVEDTLAIPQSHCPYRDFLSYGIT